MVQEPPLTPINQVTHFDVLCRGGYATLWSLNRERVYLPKYTSPEREWVFVTFVCLECDFFLVFDVWEGLDLFS